MGAEKQLTPWGGGRGIRNHEASSGIQQEEGWSPLFSQDFPNTWRPCLSPSHPSTHTHTQGREWMLLGGAWDGVGIWGRKHHPLSSHLGLGPGLGSPEASGALTQSPLWVPVASSVQWAFGPWVPKGAFDLDLATCCPPCPQSGFKAWGLHRWRAENQWWCSIRFEQLPPTPFHNSMMGVGE